MPLLQSVDNVNDTELPRTKYANATTKWKGDAVEGINASYVTQN